jgi:hypothetical protein
MISHNDAEKELFRSSGPLGSFSSRISLALLMGVVSERAYREMMIIKDVRNKFAHALDVVGFEDQWVKDKCANLNYTLDLTLTDAESTEMMRKVEAGEEIGEIKLGGEGVHREFNSSIRKRYVVTCQTFAFYLYHRGFATQQPGANQF